MTLLIAIITGLVAFQAGRLVEHNRWWKVQHQNTRLKDELKTLREQVAKGDLTGDGKVTREDLSQFMSKWNRNATR
jgi:hypothetical protein